MHIIESTNVDLIEPFPLTEAKRVFRWLHAYKNIIESDASPRTPEEFAAHMQAIIPYIRSFAVIDKSNALKFKHEAPLIGMVAFEPHSVWDYYIHLASNRRAWGSGFMDEAIRLAIDEVFNTSPLLLRMSGLVLANNKPIKGMARRMGWIFEGPVRDALTQDGEPKTLLRFGYTRKDWEAAKAPQVEEAKEETSGVAEDTQPAENKDLNISEE